MVGRWAVFFFFWLLFILGNLLKNANCFVGCLTLLKESDELEWVSEHCLVCICKLKLMHLRLRKEDLLTPLLHHGYLHRSTWVAIVEIADELYSTLLKLVHRHECGLLGSTKPADQLVANIREPGNSLKVIPDAFVKVCLWTICVVGALLCNDVRLFGQTYILKTPTHQVKQCWTIILLSIWESSQNLWIEIEEHECKEVLSSKLCLVRCDVSGNLFSSFLEGSLDTIKLFQAFFNQIVWYAISTQRRPASIPVELGCILHLDQIWHCHNLGLSWLVSQVDISCVSTRPCWHFTSAKNYYISYGSSSRWADWSFECVKKAI